MTVFDFAMITVLVVYDLAATALLIAPHVRALLDQSKFGRNLDEAAKQLLDEHAVPSNAAWVLHRKYGLPLDEAARLVARWNRRRKK